MSEWIPVSERLPELLERVMVVNESVGFVQVGFRHLTGKYHHWDGDDWEELHQPTPLDAATRAAGGATVRDILDDARKTLAGPGVATSWLIAEMIREIERLKEEVSGLRAAAENAGLVYRNTDSGPNFVPLGQPDVSRISLTESEREAIHWAIGDVADISGPPEDTLRGLLERTRKVT